ncbi:hypothetical protein HDU91_003412, partial [Kappamyces sp. JEL0680]
QQFVDQINEAIVQVRKILTHERNPVLAAADVPHSYQDKFALVELTSNLAFAALRNTMQGLGITEAIYAQAKAQDRSVTLRWEATEVCSYLRHESRVEASPSSVVVEGGLFGKAKAYIENRIDEYFWKYGVSHKLVLYYGTDIDNATVLMSRSGDGELKTLVKEPAPQAATVSRPPIEVDATYFFKKGGAASSKAAWSFKVDRTHKDCWTPRRNPQVQEALDFLSSLYTWSDSVWTYLNSSIIQSGVFVNPIDVQSLSSSPVFNPALPLMDEKEEPPTDLPAIEGSENTTEETHSALAILKNDSNALLDHHVKTLNDHIMNLQKKFPAGAGLLTAHEAVIFSLTSFVKTLAKGYSDSVDYVESMLRTQ